MTDRQEKTRNDQTPLEALHRPEFNIRQILKEMLLLEQHLAIPVLRCHDCIKKHLLTMEALVDEAYQLGPGDGMRDLLNEIRRLVLRLSHNYLADEPNYCEIGQFIRTTRKQLIPVYFKIDDA